MKVEPNRVILVVEVPGTNVTTIRQILGIQKDSMKKPNLKGFLVTPNSIIRGSVNLVF